MEALEIEVDNEQGIAVVELRGVKYFAQLPGDAGETRWTRTVRA